jgi:nucleotide-binding universal stress UspA family protein
MMKILCPTDLTLATDIALSHAGNIAQRGKGEVTLFHVLTKEEIKTKNVGNPGPHAKTMDQLSKEGVKVNRVDREGTPLKEIVTEARNGHSLMVAGTHGVRGLRQEWLGSDMLKLVREVPIPTLVVQMYTPRTEMGRILMPVAGHADITPLLDAVCMLAKVYGAEVDVYQQLQEGSSTSNTLLANKIKMLDRLAKEGITHHEVNEPVQKFYEGFAVRTIRYAHNAGASCIAIMAQSSGEHKKIADQEKQDLLVNEKGIPVLCAI